MKSTPASAPLLKQERFCSVMKHISTICSLISMAKTKIQSIFLRETDRDNKERKESQFAVVKDLKIKIKDLLGFQEDQWDPFHPCPPRRQKLTQRREAYIRLYMIQCLQFYIQCKRDAKPLAEDIQHAWL